MKRAIITGATGFIGVHLVNELLSHNVEVIALHHQGDKDINRLPAETTTITCSMDDYTKLPGLLDDNGFDAFIHLAWEGATGPGRADEAIQTKNAYRTLEALKAAKAVGCKKFVGVGTVYENFYSQMAEAPSFRNPAFYIMGKKFTRDMARQLAYKLEIEFTWCTFCHPVGKLIKPDQLLAYAIKSLLDGTSPTFGPAKDWFDIVHVEDLATGLYLAAKNNLSYPACFIGSGKPRVLSDYLNELPKILGVDLTVGIGERPDDGLRFDKNWLDATQFIKDTGFAPKYDYSRIVLDVRDYLLSTP